MHLASILCWRSGGLYGAVSTLAAAIPSIPHVKVLYAQGLARLAAARSRDLAI